MGCAAGPAPVVRARPAGKGAPAATRITGIGIDQRARWRRHRRDRTRLARRTIGAWGRREKSTICAMVAASRVRLLWPRASVVTQLRIGAPAAAVRCCGRRARCHPHGRAPAARGRRCGRRRAWPRSRAVRHWKRAPKRVAAAAVRWRAEGPAHAMYLPSRNSAPDGHADQHHAAQARWPTAGAPAAVAAGNGQCPQRMADQRLRRAAACDHGIQRRHELRQAGAAAAGSAVTGCIERQSRASHARAGPAPAVQSAPRGNPSHAESARSGRCRPIRRPPRNPCPRGMRQRLARASSAASSARRGCRKVRRNSRNAADAASQAAAKPRCTQCRQTGRRSGSQGASG